MKTFVKHLYRRGWEMAQELRGLAALPEDPSLTASTHTRQLLFPKDLMLSGLYGHWHKCDVCTQRNTIHINLK